MAPAAHASHGPASIGPPLEPPLLDPLEPSSPPSPFFTTPLLLAPDPLLLVLDPPVELEPDPLPLAPEPLLPIPDPLPAPEPLLLVPAPLLLVLDPPEELALPLDAPEPPELEPVEEPVAPLEAAPPLEAAEPSTVELLSDWSLLHPPTVNVRHAAKMAKAGCCPAMVTARFEFMMCIVLSLNRERRYSDLTPPS
jgi:hypothetical protein